MASRVLTALPCSLLRVEHLLFLSSENVTLNAPPSEGSRAAPPRRGDSSPRGRASASWSPRGHGVAEVCRSWVSPQPPSTGRVGRAGAASPSSRWGHCAGEVPPTHVVCQTRELRSFCSRFIFLATYERNNGFMTILTSGINAEYSG